MALKRIRNRDERRRAMYKYNHSDKGRATAKRYHASSKFKLVVRRYEQSAKGKRQSYEETLRLKRELLAAYGNWCECCGERHIEFLTLDHINGNGKAERAHHGQGKNFWHWLKKQGWPQGNYRILCMNCNFARRYRRPCPHERKRIERLEEANSDAQVANLQ
jgi:hypothetical protein